MIVEVLLSPKTLNLLGTGLRWIGLCSRLQDHDFPEPTFAPSSLTASVFSPGKEELGGAFSFARFEPFFSA